MEYCWNGHTIPDRDRHILREILAMPLGRKDCLQWINKRRASGRYEFSGLESVGEVLNCLLDEAYKHLDVANISTCIVLSQTFYNSSHEFLQSKIMHHPIWYDNEVWDSTFLYKVDNDMTQFSQLCSVELTSEADLVAKYRSVLFSQITTYISIMKSFELENSEVKAFVLKQAEKFGLETSEVEALLPSVSSEP